MSENETVISGFDALELKPQILAALKDSGYTTPSPIQSLTIPPLLAGKDLIGQAQTGTGKTAAFAIPFLSRLNPDGAVPQVLVLTPTRELAIQVSESFKRYASHMKWVKVLPIYGGQDYGVQINGLKRGVHVIIGTPGRVMDHMRRGTLSLAGLTGLVLDEADEMLRMGFIDDVEWVLSQAPEQRQIALFSATMPPEIRRIAGKYLRQPEQIIIQARATAAETISQKAWIVGGMSKVEALSRMLETLDADGIIVFVKTRNGAVELAEELHERGYSVAALNGDMAQKQREHTIERLKNGQLNIVVATDVAARGLDVERISHVINFDAPFDAEIYVHRIGRTGRAGRSGESILFVTHHEKRLLQTIERTTRQRIELIHPPTIEDINQRRVARFHDRLGAVIQEQDLSFFKGLVESYRVENESTEDDVAAALAFLLQGNHPFLLKKEFRAPHFDQPRDNDARGPRRSDDRPARANAPMMRYRIEVGREHNVQPGNIVGAIANETGLSSAAIGRIEIMDTWSVVELPDGMPKDVFLHLQKVWVCEQQLRIRPLGDGEVERDAPAKRMPPSHAAPRSKPLEKPFEKSARAERPARPDRADRPAPAARAERAERPARPDRADRPVPADRAERPAEIEKASRPDKPARSDKPSFPPKKPGAKRTPDGKKNRARADKVTAKKKLKKNKIKTVTIGG